MLIQLLSEQPLKTGKNSGAEYKTRTVHQKTKRTAVIIKTNTRVGINNTKVTATEVTAEAIIPKRYSRKFTRMSVFPFKASSHLINCNDPKCNATG
jgi:hypothetical protein